MPARVSTCCGDELPGIVEDIAHPGAGPVGPAVTLGEALLEPGVGLDEGDPVPDGARPDHEDARLRRGRRDRAEGRGERLAEHGDVLLVRPVTADVVVDRLDDREGGRRDLGERGLGLAVQAARLREDLASLVGDAPLRLGSGCDEPLVDAVDVRPGPRDPRVLGHGEAGRSGRIGVRPQEGGVADDDEADRRWSGRRARRCLLSRRRRLLRRWRRGCRGCTRGHARLLSEGLGDEQDCHDQDQGTAHEPRSGCHDRLGPPRDAAGVTRCGRDCPARSPGPLRAGRARCVPKRGQRPPSPTLTDVLRRGRRAARTAAHIIGLHVRIAQPSPQVLRPGLRGSCACLPAGSGGHRTPGSRHHRPPSAPIARLRRE